MSISGFGEKGPYAHKPVYDPIVQAFSGLTTVQGGADDRRPRLIRTVLPDKLTAVTAAQAIAAALVGKLRTGKGQHVRLSMLDAVLAFLWASDMGAQTYVGRREGLAAQGGELHRSHLRDGQRLHDGRRHEQQGMDRRSPRRSATPSGWRTPASRRRSCAISTSMPGWS